MSFKIAQKVKNILATFERKFVTENFKKSPNWVTLFVSMKETNRYRGLQSVYEIKWFFVCEREW